jgi:hypothetical protein
MPRTDLEDAKQLASKVTDLSSTWRSAQIVRTRDKVCEFPPVPEPTSYLDWGADLFAERQRTAFLFGVLSLAFTCLIIGLAPEWLPFAYTVQSMFYLPTRVWSYKRKAYHYFLFGEWPHGRSLDQSRMILTLVVVFFWYVLGSRVSMGFLFTSSDSCSPRSVRHLNHLLTTRPLLYLVLSLCYFVNIMDLVWLWCFPSNATFFITCYCLTMGAFSFRAIPTRNLAG